MREICTSGSTRGRELLLPAYSTGPKNCHLRPGCQGRTFSVPLISNKIPHGITHLWGSGAGSPYTHATISPDENLRANSPIRCFRSHRSAPRGFTDRILGFQTGIPSLCIRIKAKGKRLGTREIEFVVLPNEANPT